MKLRENVNKTDFIESCRRERMATKRRFFNFTNFTVFAAPLNDVHMGCQDTILPKTLFKNCTTNCPEPEQNTKQPYDKKLRFLGAPVLPLLRRKRLEEGTSKFFILITKTRDGLSPNQFEGVHMNNILVLKDMLTPNLLLRDIDTVDENSIRELGKRSVQKYGKTVGVHRQQPYLFCKQQKCCLPISSLSQLLQVFQQNFQFGVNFKQTSCTSQKCLSRERKSDPNNSP